MRPSCPMDKVDDSILVDIFSRASGFIIQTQQEEGQPIFVSNRKQQRYICGTFTRVSRRWRQAALSICTGLDICLASDLNTELVSSWLRRNGSNVQHLRLNCITNPLPLLSTLPTRTPQLKSLRASGLWRLKGVMPSSSSLGCTELPDQPEDRHCGVLGTCCGAPAQPSGAICDWHIQIFSQFDFAAVVHHATAASLTSTTV
jgi:hypothetical protein